MSLILSGTDGLSDVDGSAATPAIRGTDANTGIFFPAADTIGFSEGGVEAMRIDSSGNVGIGTASPVSRLHVTGSGSPYISVTSTNTNNFVQALDGSGLAIGTTSSATNKDILFFSSSVERARFNTTGALVFSGGTTTANGAGITFPATQSASTDANTLDDYEEGTWTPVDSSGASLSFSSAGGFYTKIGRQVICFFYVTYPATANASATAIGGLPFTTGNNVAGGVFTGAVAYNNYGSMQLVGPSSVTSFNLSTPTGADITNANMSSKTVRGSFLYFVA